MGFHVADKHSRENADRNFIIDINNSVVNRTAKHLNWSENLNITQIYWRVEKNHELVGIARMWERETRAQMHSLEQSINSHVE